MVAQVVKSCERHRCRLLGRGADRLVVVVKLL